MKRSAIAIALFLGLLVPSMSFANSAIDATYNQIHTDACSALGPNDCPSINDANERFAFVVTWCDHHPDAAACTPIKNLKGGPAVIAFNHDTQVWRAVYGLTDDQIKFDKDGIPMVLASSGRVVIPVVESTNPLLYKAVAGAVTETDPDVLKKLQTVLDKIASAGGGLVALAEGPVPKNVRNAAAFLKDPVKCVADQWRKAGDFTAQVEGHHAGDYQLFSSSCTATAAQIEENLNTLADFNPAACATEGAALSAALGLTDPVEILKQAKAPQCTALAGEVAQVQLFAKDIKAAAGDQVKIKQAKDVEVGNVSDLKEFTDFAESAAQVVSADNRTKLEDVIGKIETFEEKLLLAFATQKPKAKVDVKDVADFFIVPRGSIIVSADKDRSRTLTVTKANPFDKPIAKRPDSVSSSYSAESLYLSLIDITAAMTFTGLSDPQFGTVTEKAGTTEHPDATKQVIAKKDEKKRSGKVAAFVEFPIFTNGGVPVRRIVGAIGVGTDSSITALFAGISFRATSALHIGGGMTWQSVKTLDGQKLGDTVTADTDIKRKDKRDHSWYLSLSFSFGSVSLFKGL